MYHLAIVNKDKAFQIEEELGGDAVVPKIKKYVRPRRGQRKRTLKVFPMFDGYILIREGAYIRDSIKRKLRYVRFGDNVATISDNAVRSLDGRKVVDPEDIQTGDRIRMNGGELDGWIADVLSQSSGGTKLSVPTILGDKVVIVPASMHLERVEKQ